jgi:Cu(I)/Ag(I) efflux system membrane protein CusA/SilA
MTVLTTMIGLLPLLWSDGVGADLMKRVAAPMVGGLATSFLLELLVYPALYAMWRAPTAVRDQVEGEERPRGAEGSVP